jgi:hypothetical protein
MAPTSSLVRLIVWACEFSSRCSGELVPETARAFAGSLGSPHTVIAKRSPSSKRSRLPPSRVERESASMTDFARRLRAIVSALYRLPAAMRSVKFVIDVH